MPTRLATLLALSLLLSGSPVLMTHLQAKPTKSAAGAAVQKPAATKPEQAPAKPALAATAIPNVRIVSLLREPDAYVGKHVAFDGTFNSFATIGLDYKPAMRAATDYVTLLIDRPDIEHHTIPLSELKLFYPREKSESVMTLQKGDKLHIEGTVFAAALGEPWVDITKIDVLSKVPRQEERDSAL